MQISGHHFTGKSTKIIDDYLGCQPAVTDNQNQLMTCSNWQRKVLEQGLKPGWNIVIVVGTSWCWFNPITMRVRTVIQSRGKEFKFQTLFYVTLVRHGLQPVCDN